MDALARCIHIKGDIIECGVASGANLFPLADFAKYSNMHNDAKKVVFACDTFEGLPYDDNIQSDNMCLKGELNYGLNFKIIKSQRQDLPITMIEGLVEETLEKSLCDKKFCFAFLDMDLYLPTSYATKFICDRLSVGGIIGFHDYKYFRCPGIQKVVDEEIDYTKFRKVFDKDFCVFLMKIKD
jgi:hypothetical protein